MTTDLNDQKAELRKESAPRCDEISPAQRWRRPPKFERGSRNSHLAKRAIHPVFRADAG